MFKLFLSAFVAAVFVTSTLAQQLKTCPIVFQTTNANGMPDLPGAYGTPCQPISGKPAGNCAYNGAVTPDATCQFSLYWFAYRCCYQLQQATFTTPGPGSTFATLGPGTTAYPQNLKPICPNGALPSIVAYSNPYTVACNVSNPLNQGCPSGFQCTMASNVVNVYGQAVSTSLYNLGAALTPYLCCQTLSLQSYTNVFIDSGLSPSPVPGAPTNAIASVVFSTTAPVPPTPYAMLTDDLTYLANQIAAPITAINFLTPVRATAYYQILMFDSTTNHDCFFFANILGSAYATSTTQSTTLMLPTATPTTAAPTPLTAPQYFASVYNAGTSTTPIWTYSPVWLGPTQNTGSHRYVVLVWTTTTQLPITTTATTATPTMINLNNAAYAHGDFAPSTTAQGTVVGGSFTTVSALLAGKFSTLLGAPTYGTYFYLTN